MTTQTAVMYARCQGCDTNRMFKLGTIATERDLLRAWGYVRDLAVCACEECGQTRWDVSIRLGLLQADRPALIDRIASEHLVLH